MNNEEIDGENLSSLFAGSYFVEINDSNGCSVSTTTILTEPTSIFLI